MKILSISMLNVNICCGRPLKDCLAVITFRLHIAGVIHAQYCMFLRTTSKSELIPLLVPIAAIYHVYFVLIKCLNSNVGTFLPPDVGRRVPWSFQKNKNNYTIQIFFFFFFWHLFPDSSVFLLTAGNKLKLVFSICCNSCWSSSDFIGTVGKDKTPEILPSVHTTNTGFIRRIFDIVNDLMELTHTC